MSKLNNAVDGFINGAIGYVRISIKDQSYYSISYQKNAIIEYCTRNNLNLLSLFTDDGESSYTFDRPNWVRLEDFIKQHKGEVKYLIIFDHDRFSRNLTDALVKMEYLEKQVGMKILSIYEPVNTNTNAPEAFLNRAFKLLLANNELLKIRERTKRGIRLATESGRVVNNAPFGYKNARDENDRPIITIDPARAPIVQQMFQEFILGLPHNKIIAEAKRNGFTLKGKSALSRVLKNPVYAGLIKVSAFSDLPEKIVHALHPPLISESIYWRANEILNGRPKQKTIPKEEMPLRGHIRCPCGASFTGSFSKGRKNYYLYYRCIREGSPNYPGEMVHGLFYMILGKLTFTENVKSLILRCIKGKIEEYCRREKMSDENNKKEIAEIEKKIEKLEECLLNNEIEPAIYKKWNSKLREQKRILKKEIDSLDRKSLVIITNFEKKFPSLSNLEDVFMGCDFSSKQTLLRKVFEAGLTFDGKTFRTAYIHPTFLPSCDALKVEGIFMLEQLRHRIEKASHPSDPKILTIEEDKLRIAEQELAGVIAELMVESILH